MWKLIIPLAIILITIIIAFKILKALLFNPKVNSISHIIISLLFTTLVIVKYTDNIIFNYKVILAILILIVFIIDCIRDIVIAENYYDTDNLSDCGNKLFVTKVLSGIILATISTAYMSIMDGNIKLTIFAGNLFISTIITRTLFLIIINPIIYLSVAISVNKKISSGILLPWNKRMFSTFAPRSYYFRKITDRLEQKNIVVSNKKTIDEEVAESQAKLNKKYPEKMLAKVIDFVVGNKEFKQQRENERIALESASRDYSYISFTIFQKYTEIIPDVLITKGPVVTDKIREFPELKEYNITTYFIIKALKPFVENGIIRDEKLSDNVFDNHSYYHSKSTKQMLSRTGPPLDD